MAGLFAGATAELGLDCGDRVRECGVYGTHVHDSEHVDAHRRKGDVQLTGELAIRRPSIVSPDTA
jgi:hypothetical protein